MDDPRTAEGVEHLQTAARELLKAARSFLDVVEDVVEDPERIGGAASGIAALFTSAVKRSPAPWERAAWGDDSERSDREHRDDSGNRDEHDDLWGPDEPDDEPTEAAEAAEAAEPSVVDEPAESAVEATEAPAAEPAERPTRPAAPRRRAPASRVRRIAVD